LTRRTSQNAVKWKFNFVEFALCAVAEMLPTAPYSRWAGSRHRSSIGPLVAASNTDEVAGDDLVEVGDHGHDVVEVATLPATRSSPATSSVLLAATSGPMLDLCLLPAQREYGAVGSTSACSGFSLRLSAFQQLRGKKRNSAKFTVANSSSTHRQVLINRLYRTSLASERGDYVVFVAPLCIKGLRLVTVQLPEKSWRIGPGLC
jgi:hypothetical protein